MGFFITHKLSIYLFNMLETFRNKRVLIENSPTDNSPDRILR